MTELRMMVSKWPRGSCVGDVGGLGQQLDPITPCKLQLLQRAGQGVDGHRREIGGDILLTLRGDL